MSTTNPKKTLFIILVVCNTIIAAVLFLNQKKISELTLVKITTSTPPIQSKTNQIFTPKKGYIFQQHPLGSFSTNLASSSGPKRYLKLDIVLYVETKVDSSLLEIQNKTPNLRDELLAYINTVNPNDITKKEGLETLKAKIKDHINQNLTDDNVKRVLFTKYSVN